MRYTFKIIYMKPLKIQTEIFLFFTLSNAILYNVYCMYSIHCIHVFYIHCVITIITFLNSTFYLWFMCKFVMYIYVFKCTFVCVGHFVISSIQHGQRLVCKFCISFCLFETIFIDYIFQSNAKESIR